MTQTAAHTPLRSALHATKDHLGTLLPEDKLAVLDAEQRRLAATDEAAARTDRRIAVGDLLPTATLPDAHGREVAIERGRPVVAVFYRGAWCPFCNVALATYQREVLPELERSGVDFVAISPQGPDGTLSTEETNALTFPVLTDHAGAYAGSLGLTFDLAEDVRDLHAAIGNDFGEINAGGEWALPRPTVIVADAEGVVRFVDVQADYTQRTEPQDILDAVRTLTLR